MIFGMLLGIAAVGIGIAAHSLYSEPAPIGPQSTVSGGAVPDALVPEFGGSGIVVNGVTVNSFGIGTSGVSAIINPQNMIISCGHGTVSISLETGKVTLMDCSLDDGALAWWKAVEQFAPMKASPAAAP